MSTNSEKLFRACRQISTSLVLLRGRHTAMAELPEEALITLALEEYDGNSSEGKGELAKLAKSCQVVADAATRSGAIEKDPQGTIDWAPLLPVLPLLAKLLQEVAPPAKKRGRKPAGPKKVVTPGGIELEPEHAILRVMEDGMSAREVEKEFRERGWTMGVKRMDAPILAALRVSDLFERVSTNPDRFHLTPKAKQRLTNGTDEPLSAPPPEDPEDPDPFGPAFDSTEVGPG